ncbi:MAG: nucleotidyltransferase family protein [Actinomycetota bacterium]|nr:nucleotidyltransferase family protein [Actinomycetota bacterium]
MSVASRVLAVVGNQPGSSDQAPVRTPPSLSHTVRALRVISVARDLAADLDRQGVPVMVLKGPPLQERIFDTPAAYVSGDIDLLVPADGSEVARRLLASTGRPPDRGTLWWLDRTSTYEWQGVSVDLHWGIHAGPVPAFLLRELERALWEGATRGTHGLWEPASGPLLVYLAVHAAGHQFERTSWIETVGALAAQVDDWDVVWEVARKANVVATVTRSLRVAKVGWPEGTDRWMPVLDGWRGWVVWAATWVARGHVVPGKARQWLKSGPNGRCSGGG